MFISERSRKSLETSATIKQYTKKKIETNKTFPTSLSFFLQVCTRKTNPSSLPQNTKVQDKEGKQLLENMH